MRLRIGISLFFAKNALIYARDLNAEDVAKAQNALGILQGFGFFDGKSLGSGFVVGTVVARVDPK